MNYDLLFNHTFGLILINTGNFDMQVVKYKQMKKKNRVGEHMNSNEDGKVKETE